MRPWSEEHGGQGEWEVPPAPVPAPAPAGAVGTPVSRRQLGARAPRCHRGGAGELCAAAAETAAGFIVGGFIVGGTSLPWVSGLRLRAVLTEARWGLCVFRGESSFKERVLDAESRNLRPS